MSFRIKKPTSTFKTKGASEPREELKEEPKEELKEVNTSKKKQSKILAEFNEKE